jgi:hypothetical protein
MKHYSFLTISCICLQFGYGQMAITQMRTFMQISLANGRLMAALNGRTANELFSDKKDHFFLKNINCQMEFKRAPAGGVKELLVYFNKQVVRYRKVGSWKLWTMHGKINTKEGEKL